MYYCSSTHTGPVINIIHCPSNMSSISYLKDYVLTRLLLSYFPCKPYGVSFISLSLVQSFLCVDLEILLCDFILFFALKISYAFYWVYKIFKITFQYYSIKYIGEYYVVLRSFTIPKSPDQIQTLEFFMVNSYDQSKPKGSN